jgi:hypothetical protein
VEENPGQEQKRDERKRQGGLRVRREGSRVSKVPAARLLCPFCQSSFIVACGLAQSAVI